MQREVVYAYRNEVFTTEDSWKLVHEVITEYKSDGYDLFVAMMSSIRQAALRDILQFASKMGKENANFMTHPRAASIPVQNAIGLALSLGFFVSASWIPQEAVRRE